VTHKQIRDQVVGWLGLQDAAVLDETQLVKDLIYQGTIDLLSRTRCVVRCVNLTTQAGVDTYTLDHGLLGLVEISNGSLPKARRDQTDYAPAFTLIRADVLRLEPVPSTSGTVQVWAVVRPTQMVQDSDSPGMEQFGAIPDEYHDAIVTYALWKASDYADDASSQMGERYRVLYEGPDGRAGRLGQIRMLVNKRGTARAPRRRATMPRYVHTHDHWVG